MENKCVVCSKGIEYPKRKSCGKLECNKRIKYLSNLKDKEKHPNRINNYAKKYYQKNSNILKEKSKDYKKNHKENYRELNRKYHNKIMFDGKKQQILERDNFECQECGMNQEQHIIIYGYGLIIHHKDGQGKNSLIKNNNLDNLQTICRKCHTSIHNKQRIGKLNSNFRR